MRTDEEILAHIAAVDNFEDDWLGTRVSDLLGYLPFEKARPLLREDIAADEWSPADRGHDAVKAEMLAYMDFAWGKANGRRGISAGRSLDHMSVWLWMLGREAAAEQVRVYEAYGKNRLRAICEEFGWDWKRWDDGRWANDSTAYGRRAPEAVEALAE